jgi:hypothetical protein
MNVATIIRLNPVTLRRLELEDAVERALAALDALDGDPDLEDADSDSEHDGREPEEDDDQSDQEPSQCGIFMPACGGQGDDREATSAPFTMNQLVSS